MEWQAHRLRSLLDQEDSWSLLTDEYPGLMAIALMRAKAEGVAVDSVVQRLLQLYSRYCEEWKGFSSRRLLTAERSEEAAYSGKR
jgi:hypothetical protein